MNKEINVLELSSILANTELENNWEYDENIFIVEDNGDIRYCEKAQDIFNELYDKYYKIITSI